MLTDTLTSMDRLDRLKAALAHRYPIERPLGAGGMATVYLARDLKHDRPVAVKVLHPELTVTLGTERFLREIGIAARLTHPHILPLHDSGEAAGFLYYVMPYVEGESLRDWLAREPQLAVIDALQVTRDVASALSYAHSHNIVHRDIKPANILIHAGHAVVADFGIAHAMTASTKAQLTATGAVIGTPRYMSPEQIDAEPIDHRSDIYSLGCVLFESLAGQPPFTGPTAGSICRQHVSASVPSLTTFRSGVPRAVEDIINATMAKAPSDRYASAEALAEDLSVEIAAATDPTRTRLSRQHGVRRWPVVGALTVVGAVTLLAAALGLQQAPSRAAPGLATQRQVTFVGNVVEASVSPGGDFLAYTTEDGDGTTLMVQELASGSLIEIASNPGSLFHPRWSHDGRQILVGGFDSTGGHLRAYPRLGGDPYAIPTLWAAEWSIGGHQVYSWLSDAPYITFHTLASGTDAKFWTADSTAWFVDAAQHPGGDALALAQVSRIGEVGTIWRLTIDSAQRFDATLPDVPRRAGGYEALVEDVVGLQSVGWSPEGRALYYLRQDQGTYDLFALPTGQDGAAQGPPQLVVSGLEVMAPRGRPAAFSLTADGATAYYVKGGMSWNLWTVQPDDETWRVEPLTVGTAVNLAPRPSPDGEWVAYKSTIAGRTNVFVVSSRGGAPRQLTHVDSVSGDPVWSPDGESLAFGLTRDGRNRIAMVSVSGQAGLEVFITTELSDNGTIEWAPGAEILYQRPSLRNFHFLDPATGAERPLLSVDSAAVGYAVQARFSPDGSQLAMRWNRAHGRTGVYLVALEDGAMRRLPNTDAMAPVGWSPDGRTVYALEPDRRNVFAVPADGGTPRLLTTLPFEPSRVGTTYQGDWFVFSALETKGDVWRVESFDPER